MAVQLITYFSPLEPNRDIPNEYQNPFNDKVHALAEQASYLLQAKMNAKVEQTGTMFGVLVVLDAEGALGFLSGYSEKLNGADMGIQFVPQLALHPEKIEYVVRNKLGEDEIITHFFKTPKYLTDIGDCSTTKLIQYAVSHNLKPLASTEFWWGKSPENRIRYHGYFYAACRGKCAPVLAFLLKEIIVSPIAIIGNYSGEGNQPEILYEDDCLMVVNKPAGLLSVPGKSISDSVITRLQKRMSRSPNLVLLHRLDLATSGVLIVAKTVKANRIIQKQFIQRTIEKQYVAILSQEKKRKSKISNFESGTINLPLRVDIEDRPRQMVCHSHGKQATTKWELIAKNENSVRVNFFPITGRTHQLRVHAAHSDGLNAPIVGDALYGKKASRMMLHAQIIRFSHPTSGERIEIKSPAPF